MVNGIHALIYAADAPRARAFFREVLGWPGVDAGRGWLIFAMPPGEIAAHPAEDEDDNGRCDLYLMCDDVHATVAQLRAKGVEVLRPVADRGWGLVTSITIPGAGEMGLYQPKHPVAIGIKKKAAAAKKAKKKVAKKRSRR